MLTSVSNGSGVSARKCGELETCVFFTRPSDIYIFFVKRSACYRTSGSLTHVVLSPFLAFSRLLAVVARYRHLRTVTHEEAMEFAKKHNLAFLEVRGTTAQRSIYVLFFGCTMSLLCTWYEYDLSRLWLFVRARSPG